MTDYKILLAADGSLVLPADLRAEAGWRPGEWLTVECDGDSLFVRRCEATATADAIFEELRHRREQLRTKCGTGPDGLAGIRAERDEC